MVTVIGERAFESARISDVIIPETVTSIGDYAFYRCLSLTSVAISMIYGINEEDRDCSTIDHSVRRRLENEKVDLFVTYSI